MAKRLLNLIQPLDVTQEVKVFLTESYERANATAIKLQFHLYRMPRLKFPERFGPGFSELPVRSPYAPIRIPNPKANTPFELLRVPSRLRQSFVFASQASPYSSRTGARYMRATPHHPLRIGILAGISRYPTTIEKTISVSRPRENPPPQVQ